MKTLKTESVAEFLARGGKITKVVATKPVARPRRQAREKADVADVDMSALPEALKIRYGIR